MPPKVFFSRYWQVLIEKPSDLEHDAEDHVFETGAAKTLNDTQGADSARSVGVSFPPFWQPLPDLNLEFGFGDPVLEIGTVDVPEKTVPHPFVYSKGGGTKKTSTITKTQDK